MARLKMDPAFAERNVNEGFSGGEKKRLEILQLALQRPKLAVLDETDSGLDIDALKVVSAGVNRFAAAGDKSVLLITHYTRILNYIKPDFVHVFVAGKIVEAGVGLVQDGDPRLQQLELEDLVALLLAAGEALVDVALGEGGVHVQRGHGLLHLLDPGAQLGGLAADRRRGGAQEVRHGDARDLDGVLHLSLIHI